MPSEDITFKLLVFKDNTISVFTDDLRCKPYGIGLSGRYQFTELLEMSDYIKSYLKLNPKFELVRGDE